MSQQTVTVLRLGIFSKRAKKLFTEAEIEALAAYLSQFSEIATIARSLPRTLVGNETLIHTRRPEAWVNLSQTDAALLDFLRAKGRLSELSPKDTARRVLALLSEQGCFENLLAVADSEPPRVRAMLGAIGQELDKNSKMLARLRAGLNPLSRFDFGTLAELPHAHEWQAKESN